LLSAGSRGETRREVAPDIYLLAFFVQQGRIDKRARPGGPAGVSLSMPGQDARARARRMWRARVAK
jgi:hypothetical protein